MEDPLHIFDEDDQEQIRGNSDAQPSASAGPSRIKLKFPSRRQTETQKELEINNPDDFQSDHLDSSSEEGRYDSGESDYEAPTPKRNPKAQKGKAKQRQRKGPAPMTGKRKRAPSPPAPFVQSSDEGSIRSDGGEDSERDEARGDIAGELAWAERTKRGSRFLRRLLEEKERPVKNYGNLALKQDHESRPLWIDSHGKIILEGFSAIAEQAQDFLVAIAEPVSRPSFIHEYRVSEYSLYAAMSVGLETQDIVEVLGRLSKTPLPKQLVLNIHQWTASYGKLKLVLKRNRYSLESAVPSIIQQLLADPEISACRNLDPSDGRNAQNALAGNATGNRVMTGGVEEIPAARRDGLVIPGTEQARNKAGGQLGEADATGGSVATGWDKDDLLGAVIGIDRADEMDEEDRVQSFEIDGTKMETVKRRCQIVGLPVLEEYDFRADTVNPNLDIDLKPMTVIRPYQETSLSKMFGNGRARSGIIVLPCGAGKTLVGITAACTIKKSVLVLCTSAVSAQQWKQAFIQFTNVSERQISVFTASSYDLFHGAKDGAAGIVISVYSMVAYTGQRSHGSKTFMDFLQGREWGCLLLDEVHVAPANAFRRSLENIRTHAKLGLTATLVREDDRIADLNYIIGPKLYEANWMDLAKKGHIANVQCAEVWCKMTPEFYREYLREASRKRVLLHVMNPAKFQACQFLIQYHEARGDKIIVFSDNVYALMEYAKKLQKAAIHGGTPEIERMRILSRFQHDPNMNTIFLSKVGDTSIDLPEATCLIQISSHYGSRRQEAQRLGRILRAKRRNDEGFNAFFYSLVSKDTAEMYYSTKRQGFLVDQGYAFKVITELSGIEQMQGMVYPDRSSQLDLLHSVLLQGEDSMRLGDDDPEEALYSKKNRKSGERAPSSVVPGTGMLPAIRMTGSMTALSGAQHMSYREQDKALLNKKINREDRVARKNGLSNRSDFFRKEDASRKKMKQSESARDSQTPSSRR